MFILLCILSYFAGLRLALIPMGGYLVLKVVKYFLRRNRGQVDKSNEVDVEGKLVIVTGASAGIGKATVLEFIERGAKVVLACRNIAKTEKVVQELRQKTEKGEMIIMQLDLGSLQSIRDFVQEFKSKFSKLDILINNAGLSNLIRRTTKDGFEEQFGVNHLGHFLLTNLLLDELKKGEIRRIVNVGSFAHTWGKLNFDDLMHDNTPPPSKPLPIMSGFYSNSKLANSLFNLELAKRLQGSGVNTYCLCPGFVKTDIGTDRKSGIAKYVMQMFRYFAKSAEEGAATTIYCALSRNVTNHSGEMYRNCEFWDAGKRPKLSHADAARLWSKSEKLVGLDK